MPIFQQLRSTGYRKRSKVLPPYPNRTTMRTFTVFSFELPPYPNRTTMRTFTVPEIFLLNLLNEPFLIHYSADPHRISCSDKILCFGRFISNRNLYKNGESVKGICSFISNCAPMGFRV